MQDSSYVPHGYKTPPFPSLYTPSFTNTDREIGVFLYDASGEWILFLPSTWLI